MDNAIWPGEGDGMACSIYRIHANRYANQHGGAASRQLAARIPGCGSVTRWVGKVASRQRDLDRNGLLIGKLYLNFGMGLREVAYRRSGYDGE